MMVVVVENRERERERENRAAFELGSMFVHNVLMLVLSAFSPSMALLVGSCSLPSRSPARTGHRPYRVHSVHTKVVEKKSRRLQVLTSSLCEDKGP